ncbi:MAG: transporter, partial [Maritimibacter sp.]
MKRLRMVAMAFALATAPLAASAESLSDALVSAYRNSGLLDQQRALLRATDEDLAVAVAAT